VSQPYVGEIRMFGGNFAPAGWMFCEGQVLPIAENDILFNLIGTTYGGDGQSTFALPDLRGRLPLHQGSGFMLAQTGGSESVTLTTVQMPTHTHPLLASTDPATVLTPQSNVPATTASATPYFNNPPATALAAAAVSAVGGSQPHENLQPFLCVNFIIALFGLFPPPS
jgi:microcystin-dependent protein